MVRSWGWTALLSTHLDQSGTSTQMLLDHHVALSAPGMCDDLSAHSPQVLHPTPPAPELLSAVTHGNEWNIPLTVGAALWEL